MLTMLILLLDPISHTVDSGSKPEDRPVDHRP